MNILAMIFLFLMMSVAAVCIVASAIMWFTRRRIAIRVQELETQLGPTKSKD